VRHVGRERPLNQAVAEQFLFRKCQVGARTLRSERVRQHRSQHHVVRVAMPRAARSIPFAVRTTSSRGAPFGEHLMESLILAQDKRWRRT
jgi:hypothetical protein